MRLVLVALRVKHTLRQQICPRFRKPFLKSTGAGLRHADMENQLWLVGDHESTQKIVLEL